MIHTMIEKISSMFDLDLLNLKIQIILMLSLIKEIKGIDETKSSFIYLESKRNRVD